jgi:hypothetical protein
MNTYLWIHRAKFPIMLLVFGVTALLNQYDVISYGKSWPLYLITFGILQLAERAAWSQAQASFPPQPPYPGYPYPGQAQGYPNPVPSQPAGSSTSLTITPHDGEEGR